MHETEEETGSNEDETEDFIHLREQQRELWALIPLTSMVKRMDVLLQITEALIWPWMPDLPLFFYVRNQVGKVTLRVALSIAASKVVDDGY